MILTGPAIERAHQDGTIIIAPFDSSNVNPNSYNYHLGTTMLVPTASSQDETKYTAVELPERGFLLEPRKLYLASTHEMIGSNTFVTTLLGRSSLGRLGLFLNSTADLGHLGAVSQWTLELSVVQPLRIYPLMCVGQVAFWEQFGEPLAYAGRYHGDSGPVSNRDQGLAGPARRPADASGATE